MNKISLGYLRVSTQRQDLSLGAQSEALHRASEYHETGPISLFAEADTSGSTEFARREQGGELLQRARECIANGYAVTVIAAKVDRLGRNVIDVNQTVRYLESLGCRIIFLDLNVDTTTAMGRAFLQIAAVFAELELARIRERIQTVIDQKRDHGLLTGTVPFGWDTEPTGRVNRKGIPEQRLVENPAEQQWIMTMQQWQRAGWSWYRMAKELSARGVPTKCTGKLYKGKDGIKRPVSGRWQAEQVKTLLQSKTVQAKLASDGTNPSVI